ncbi:MAG TPA: hypothetical protein VN894_13265 [Polyangiaceae bacterium]|nr:hypothetical protein [Polyangiaceae bacterium]
MKSTLHVTLYDLPLCELRARTDRARHLLREAQASAAHPLDKPDRASDWRAIGDAIDATERLLPGLMEPPRTLLARSLRGLAPHERRVLREAIGAERAARERLARLLGDVPLAQVHDALERIEAHESVAAQLSALCRLLDGMHAPILA